MVINEVMKEEVSPLTIHIAEHFGRSILRDSVDLYQSKMMTVHLPTDVEHLQRKKESYANESLSHFDKEMTGLHHSVTYHQLRDELLLSVAKAYERHLLVNEKDSHAFNNQIMEESLMIIKDKDRSEAIHLKKVVIEHYDKYAVGPTKEYYRRLLQQHLALISTEMRVDIMIGTGLCIIISVFMHKFSGISLMKSLIITIVVMTVISTTKFLSASQLSLIDTVSVVYQTLRSITPTQYTVICTTFCIYFIFSVFN